MTQSLTQDFRLARAMIEAGLLQEIDTDHVRAQAPHGAVLISCGDRDRFRFHFDGCGGIIDVHPVCLNGGAVLLGEGVDAIRQQVILEDCGEAFQVKPGMDFIFALSHFPCGKCAKLGFGFRDTALKTLEGKRFLKQHIPTNKLKGVLPLVSIDWRSSTGQDRDAGVKLYAMRRQDEGRIASFGLTDMNGFLRPRHEAHHPDLQALQ